VTVEVDSLVEAIRAAFSGVPRGETTIHEAEVIDDYGGPEERLAARALDTETRWEDVPDRDIAKCSCALTYLDEISWRYYIAAYMVWSLRHLETTDSLSIDHTIYALDPGVRALKDTDSERRFSSLTLAQSRVVLRFLWFMAERPDQADDVVALRAIDRYWSRFEDAAPS
jgi:hypothetical protein